MRYNPPPNWPVPPGWTPEPGWTPDPSWPPAPPGWQFWIDDSAAGWPPVAPVPPPRKHTARNVLIGVGAVIAVVVAVIVALAAIGVFASKSDEDKIRDVVSDVQDAWNRSDYDTVVSHFCAKSRSNSSEDNFKDSRSKSGTIKFKISSIKVDGDNAKVDVTETYSKRSDPDTETLKFTKEDGKWTLCNSASE
ncbi:MAG TPA: nuclear transport factor 2 family protein [Mycobacterium sp.]|jgi:hypothetical protein